MLLKIIGPPQSGRTTLALELEKRLLAAGRAVAVRDDGDNIRRFTEGAGPAVEIHTVHRPGEKLAQPGDLPAFLGGEAVLNTAQKGWLAVLRPGKPEAFLRSADRGLLADLALCALGFEPAPAAEEAEPEPYDLFRDAV